MKKSSLCVAGMLIALVCLLSATSDASGADALRKFGRGIANLTWGWTDLPLAMHREDTLNGPVAAYTYGIVRGLAKAVSRTAVGIYEIASFPIPWPDGYWPIIGPEAPIQNYNENILMYE